MDSDFHRENQTEQTNSHTAVLQELLNSDLSLQLLLLNIVKNGKKCRLRSLVASRRVGPARIAGQRWPKRRTKALILKWGAQSFVFVRKHYPR